MLGQVRCKACKVFGGKHATYLMHHSHVSKHLATQKHKHCLQALDTLVSNVPMNIPAAPVKKQFKPLVSFDHISLQTKKLPDNPDHPLKDIWADLFTDCTYAFTNYFEELQRQMEEGKVSVMCLLYPHNKLGLEMDSDTMGANDNEDRLFDALVSEINSTVTPKTVPITNPNVVHEVHRNHLWEFHLAVVESKIVPTNGYK